MFDTAAEKLVILSAHWNENLDWLEESEFPVIVSTNNNHFERHEGSKLFVDEKLRSPLNTGREASCYLRYIVEYYDRLPEYTAFIHGHENGWHQKLPCGLLEGIKKARYTEFDYISINTCPIGKECLSPGNPHWDAPRELWPIEFEPHVGIALPSSIECDCCAQFIVNRDKIRQYPLDVWKRWLLITQEPCHVPSHHFYFMAWVFEYTWHILFGEPIEVTQTPEEYRAQRFCLDL